MCFLGLCLTADQVAKRVREKKRLSRRGEDLTTSPGAMFRDFAIGLSETDFIPRLPCRKRM